jgi:hypothetical protein
MDIADKIRKIEALIAGAKSDGERQAAKFAKARLQKKVVAKPVEFAVRLRSLWEKKLFTAICNKHGLRTYRFKGQKHTTAMVRLSKSFMDEVLWPEYKKYAKILDKLTNEILSDLISQIHSVEEETVIDKDAPLIEQSVL